MAFIDQLDLRTAVVEMVGSADFIEVWPRLLLLAEAHLNRKLKTRHQVTATTMTVTDGFAALPADFIEMIGVYDGRGCEYVEQILQMQKLTWSRFYAVNASGIVIQDGEYNIEYYAKLPTISENLSDSNWLLREYPSVYLYAAGNQAARQVKDAELMAVTSGMLRDELAEVCIDDDQARYSRARVRVAGLTP